MNYSFQKTDSFSVYFYSGSFFYSGLFLIWTRIRHKVFWVQHISENKVGRGEEEVGGILWSSLKLVQVQMRPSLQAGYIEDTCPTYWSLEPCLQISEFAGYVYASGIRLLRISPIRVLLMFISQYLGKKMFAELYVQPAAWQISFTDAQVLNWNQSSGSHCCAIKLFISGCHMACLVPLDTWKWLLKN